MSSHGCQDVCGGCKQRFKRLSTHIALSALCAEHYKNAPVLRTSRRFADTSTEVESPSQPSAVHLQPCHGVHDESPCKFVKTAASLPEEDVSSRLNSAYVRAPVHENNATIHNDDSSSPAFDGFDDNDACAEPAYPVEDDNGPDKSVLELYEKLLLLRANPLELEKFSQEEKVQIQLLQLLNELKAPLNAFTVILNWAAKANDCGYFFKVGGQPSRNT